MLNIHQPVGWPLSCGGSDKHVIIANCAAKVGNKYETPPFLPIFFLKAAASLIYEKNLVFLLLSQTKDEERPEGFPKAVCREHFLILQKESSAKILYNLEKK